MLMLHCSHRGRMPTKIHPQPPKFMILQKSSGARIRTWEMADPKSAALPLGHARSLVAHSIVSTLRLYHAAKGLTRCNTLIIFQKLLFLISSYFSLFHKLLKIIDTDTKDISKTVCTQ